MLPQQLTANDIGLSAQGVHERKAHSMRLRYQHAGLGTDRPLKILVCCMHMAW